MNPDKLACDRLVELLTRHQGKLLLCSIPQKYEEMHGSPLPIHGKVKLSNWLTTVNGVTVEKHTLKNPAHAVLSRLTMPTHDIDTTTDRDVTAEDLSVADFMWLCLKNHFTELTRSTITPSFVKSMFNIVFFKNQFYSITPEVKEWYNKTTPSEASETICKCWVRKGYLRKSPIAENSFERLDEPSANSTTANGFNEIRMHKSSAQELSKKPGCKLVEDPWNIVAELSHGLPASVTGQMDNMAIVCDLNECGVICVMAIKTHASLHVIDCRTILTQELLLLVKHVFKDRRVVKIVHNLHRMPLLLREAFGKEKLLENNHEWLDTQLAIEYLSGFVYSNSGEIARRLNVPGSWVSILEAKSLLKLTKHEPLSQRVVDRIEANVSLLWDVGNGLIKQFESDLELIKKVSCARARLEERHVVFNKSRNYAIASGELMRIVSSDDEIFELIPLCVHTRVDDLLRLLPKSIQIALQTLGTDQLSDIVLDKGRPPHCWINGKRIYLQNSTPQRGIISSFLRMNDSSLLMSEETTDAQIMHVVDSIGGFGSDNRAGIERQLHRVSCIRNRPDKIIGLTLRVGRNVDGNAHMIADLLFGNEGSVLFLGEPGCGKTTIVREATKLLSETSNVCIVDTSNEIAGDGDIPHPCVGRARRMMVPSLEHQAAVMIECIQNHTPSVMVIDEIGRNTEVEAARTCKQRGVRMVASAHGNLRKLVKNPKLKGLIGGTETVTLGDIEAKRESKLRGFTTMTKLKAQRSGSPVFEIIVELCRANQHEWSIVFDSGEAVDKILSGMEYKAQKRIRNPRTGSFELVEVML